MKRRVLAAAALLTLAALGAQASWANRQQPSSPAPAPAQATAYELREIAFPEGHNGYENCALARLRDCGNINALVWDENFQREVAEFLGARRRAYLWHEDGREGPDASAPLVSEAMLEVLGGPPDPAARVGPYLAFAGCRTDSCPEKGIAVLTREGELVALGILHYWNEPGEVEARRCCGASPDFDIYHRPVDDIARLLPALRGWAIERAASAYRPQGAPAPELKGLRLFAVRSASE